MPALRYPFPPATIDDVARASGCSSRTVRRFLRGDNVSPPTRLSIERAMRARRLAAAPSPAPSASPEQAGCPRG